MTNTSNSRRCAAWAAHKNAEMTSNHTLPQQEDDSLFRKDIPMENLAVSITDDDKLVLVVDLKQEVGYTKYERSVCIASSRGNINVWQDGKLRPEKFNLNVFRSLTAKEKLEGVRFETSE